MMDKSKFIDQYKAETRERLQRLNQGVLALEKKPRDKALLEAMMREAHTIKGSSIMMGYQRVADVTHGLETGFQKALSGQLHLEKKQFDLIFECLDAIDPLLDDKVTWKEKGVEYPVAQVLCDKLAVAFAISEKKKAPKTPVAPKPAPKVTPPPIPSPLAHRVGEDSIRIDIDKLDSLMNLSGELLVSGLRLDTLTRQISQKVDAAARGEEVHLQDVVAELVKADGQITQITTSIKDEVTRLRMVPVAYLFSSFPRAMRDLAHERGKEINFEIHGDETQLDKAILDQLKEPLLHLLRNAVDHGIETGDERVDLGKTAEGKITLSAFREANQVVIEVADDGAGIDPEKVRRKAVEKGLLPTDRAGELGEEQVVQLLFTPGFSTKSEVTEVSGRGFGLDVVREKISFLKGRVEIASKIGEGTRFSLRLPLTMAITESLIVISGTDTYAFPIESVVETIRARPDEVRSVEGKDVITVRGYIMPLIRLGDLFGLPVRGILEREFFPVVVVQSVERKIAIQVDHIQGRQEIVIKALGDPLQNVKNISGATIMGDGGVVLILDVPSIIDSCEGVIIKRVAAAAGPTEMAKKRKKTILLAEDALTTAMLEKNILESAGFSVVIARDGSEALKKAAQEKFDLIITDVLMPNMDGFELTTALKRDKILKDIPVIIVTTRESDADKRRGMDAGASAYILKSEFTSEGLLETIERLIG